MKSFSIFLAIVAVIAGVVLLLPLALPSSAFYWDPAGQTIFGIILLAGGLTYLWKCSGYRGLKPR